MSKLHQIEVSLTKGQKQKLARAYRNNEGVTIRLAIRALSGERSAINGTVISVIMEKIIP